jgi:glycosyltransferase involved in cell wall biosynthesis
VERFRPIELANLSVMQVIPALGTGGLERVAAELTLGLAPRVRKLVVCGAGGTGVEPRLREARIDIRRIPRPRSRVRDVVRAARKLARILEEEHVDVVHAHNPAAGAAVALARTIAGCRDVPLVTSYHGVSDERIARASRVLRWTSDLVIAVGPTAMTELRAAGLPPGRSVIVFNAVGAATTRDAGEVRAEFAATDSEFVVSVGRYVAQKNHRLLVEALALLAPRRPRLRAALVGFGELREDLERQIAAHGLGEKLVLTGRRTDPVDIAAAADVFVLPSVWEGLPVSLLEAMAHGRPVVATTVRGIWDIVRDEETGLLVPPDDPAALAAAVERLLEDRALAEKLGASGREYVTRRFSRDTMVDRHAAVYESLVASRHA